MRNPLPSLTLLAVSCLILGGCKRVIRETQDFVGAPRRTDSVAAISTVVVVSSGAEHEATEGLGPIVVRLRRFEPDSITVSVDFSTRVGVVGRQPAAPYMDYRPVRGTLTWGPNDGSERTITIEILRDEFFESTESFAVGLTNVVGARLAVSSIACRIREGSSLRKFAADVDQISARTGGVQRLVLRAGAAHAKRRYLIAGSLGTAPGIRLSGTHVPLNVDWWFHTSLLLTNTALLQRFRGIFDTQGDALAEIHLGPLFEPSIVGLRFFHAYIVYDSNGTVRMASNSVPLRIGR
jgi:Calx-beta domain